MDPDGGSYSHGECRKGEGLHSRTRMKLTRRQALLLSVLGVPAAAVTALALRHAGDPGDVVSAAERRALRCLDVGEYATLKQAMRRLTRATRGGFPTADTVEAAPFVERYIASMHRLDRDDMRRLLSALEHVLPIGAGTTLPFSRAPGDVQDRVLDSMETSALGLLRAGFAALKQLTAMAYFRDARTFAAIGYDGPRVPPASSPVPREVYGTPVPHAAGTTFDVDAVVIGAGAGGSMAAREIARAGASVLLLEEGPDHPPESFTQREDEMLAALYQDSAGRATRDRAIHIMQGRGLGGSTIHNQNLCKRAPSPILDAWAAGGLDGWDAASMAPLFQEVETLLNVQPIGDVDVNENNLALRRGATALGWHSGPLSHNRDGCRRSGFCELGCAYDGKNNARKVVIPDAVAHGARVRANTRVDRVRMDGRRAVGVDATDVRTGRTVTVRARAVVLAGSAVGSAFLAIRSAVPDPHGRLGRGLHIHPGGVVAGIFDREISGWHGIPQSIESTEFLRFDRGSDRRVWIVPAFAHPVGAASMLPGVGPAWMNGMRNYPRMAVLTSMLHDETQGRVSVEYGRPVIDYVLGASDREQMARGMRACGEILLAAGAREVVLPFSPPVRVRTSRGLSWLTAERIQPLAMPLAAVHPMSSMRAGANASTSVCDPTGQHHHVRGLFVADGGLFPTSLGGPPQISIYTAGLKVGRKVVAFLAHCG